MVILVMGMVVVVGLGGSDLVVGMMVVVMVVVGLGGGSWLW